MDGQPRRKLRKKPRKVAGASAEEPLLLPPLDLPTLKPVPPRVEPFAHLLLEPPPPPPPPPCRPSSARRKRPRSPPASGCDDWAEVYAWMDAALRPRTRLVLDAYLAGSLPCSDVTAGRVRSARSFLRAFWVREHRCAHAALAAAEAFLLVERLRTALIARYPQHVPQPPRAAASSLDQRRTLRRTLDPVLREAVASAPVGLKTLHPDSDEFTDAMLARAAEQLPACRAKRRAQGST